MKFKSWLLAAAFVVPLHEQGNWQILEFKSIKANAVKFDGKGMFVAVDHSASPIIYPLPDAMSVSQVSVEGEIFGLPKVNVLEQGNKGQDDFGLKVGLVLEGEKTLGFGQKLIAPKWVKTLFALAPEGTGVDKIYFLNAVQHESLKGKKRQHPLSELIYEENAWFLNGPGEFSFKHKFTSPVKVRAIWLSIDGDDTKSKYSIVLKNLKLASSN